MRPYAIVVPVAIGAGALLYACATPGAARPTAAAPTTDREELSYGVGFYLGEEVREGLELDAVDADLDLLVRGFADAVRERKAMMSRDDMDEVLFTVHEEMQRRSVERMLADNAAFKDLYDRNLQRSSAYHEAHAKEAGVNTLPSGAQYRVVESGAGPSPGLRDTVVVNFRSRLIDGTEVNAGEGVAFEVDSVIAGASELVQLMKVGDTWEMALPPDLAYGPGGQAPLVGPNETVIGTVELLAIEPGAGQ